MKLTADVQAVLDGGRTWGVQQADAVSFLRVLPADSVNMMIGSPPYCDARDYLEDGKNLNVARDCLAWVEWMLEVTEAAARACVGPIFWVAAGVTRDRNYWPACEGLLWEWFKRGGSHQLYRPCAWTRSGIPGSGGDDYLRADWEYVLCFKRPGKLPWSDNTAMGHPPKYAPGGEMSHRIVDGTRKNSFGIRTDVPVGSRTHGKKRTNETYRAVKTRLGRNMANGIPGSTKVSVVGKKHTKRTVTEDGDVMEEQFYEPPVIANPGNVINIPVGGLMLGSDLAHVNEAPFPEKLAAFFVRSFCAPGALCCDPFSGSGTTLKVALAHGRRFVGCDLRESQVNLSKRRAQEAVPWVKDDSIPGEPLPLFPEM